MDQQQDAFTKKQKLMILMTVSCFAMMIVVIIVGWYLYRYSLVKIQKNDETIAVLLKNANLQNVGEFSDKSGLTTTNLSAEEVIKMVGKHMLLANGDAMVATITNVEGLRTDYPELFTYAKDGDRLIFYSLGIIIYDPALDKVVDVLRRLPEGVTVPTSVTEEKK